MTLPFLISVPHAGLRVPPEVVDICLLEEQDIVDDSDVGALGIYYPLREKVAAFVTADIARAIVDMNRREDDMRKDGVVKTHTCWGVPIYKEIPSEEVISLLIQNYHRPYHAKLSQFNSNILMGIDCHTMAEVGPPVGPDPGSKRPRACLSNGNTTCPDEWIDLMAECFEDSYNTEININSPFKGGHIIRSHANAIPWIQVELSREPFIENKEKGARFLSAIQNFLSKLDHSV